MYTNGFYSPEVQGPYEMIDIGRLELENGGVIEHCELAVATHGELNEAKDNAVLLATGYSGSHRQWNEDFIGPEHALDPGRYFIVVTNPVGNGLSVSPHNTDDTSIAMSRFPLTTNGDDVVAQERLLREHLHVGELFAVVGSTTGSRQVYEWAARFPEKVGRAAVIACTARNTPYVERFTESLIAQITSDPGFRDGEYSSNEEVADGLTRHAQVLLLLGLSPQWWREEGWRLMGMESGREFTDGLFTPIFTGQDPNALVHMVRKWQQSDIAELAGGDLAAALGRIRARFLIMPIDEDLIFPVPDCAADAELIPDSRVRILHDPAGHLGLFAFDPRFREQVDRHLAELFAD